MRLPLYQGGELEVLKSINWSLVKFDVLCIETFPLERPPNYAEDVTEFLAEKGYINHSGQQGRNICKKPPPSSPLSLPPPPHITKQRLFYAIFSQLVFRATIAASQFTTFLHRVHTE